MSTEMGFHELPDWDAADRLAKSLRHTGVSVTAMAQFLGVHRNSVSAWINGRTPVNERTFKLWAERTGWPLEWLRDGTGPGPKPPAHPSLRPQEAGAAKVRRLHPVGSVAGGREQELVNADVDEDAIAWVRLADQPGQPNTSTVGVWFATYRPAAAA